MLHQWFSAQSSRLSTQNPNNITISEAAVSSYEKKKKKKKAQQDNVRQWLRFALFTVLSVHIGLKHRRQIDSGQIDTTACFILEYKKKVDAIMCWFTVANITQKDSFYAAKLIRAAIRQPEWSSHIHSITFKHTSGKNSVSNHLTAGLDAVPRAPSSSSVCARLREKGDTRIQQRNKGKMT